MTTTQDEGSTVSEVILGAVVTEPLILVDVFIAYRTTGPTWVIINLVW